MGDGSGVADDEPKPKREWLQHVYRVLTLFDDQVVSLRKRQVIGSFVSNDRLGAYWAIRGHIADYGLPDALPAPVNCGSATPPATTRSVSKSSVMTACVASAVIFTWAIARTLCATTGSS